MPKFRIGQEIVTDAGVRGYVVYPFAVPSSVGPGVTVKLMNMRQECVIPECQLWDRNEYYRATYLACLAEGKVV